MSKKFKFGQIIGIFVGVTIGAVATSYLTQSIFGKSRDHDLYQGNYGGGQPQFNQAAPQQEVFEQALSTPINNTQNRVY